MAGRGKRSGRRGGGSVLKTVGVSEGAKADVDVVSIMDRLEAGGSLTRKQRLFSTAFVKAVARRRIIEKKTKAAAASRFTGMKVA